MSDAAIGSNTITRTEFALFSIHFDSKALAIADSDFTDDDPGTAMGASDALLRNTSLKLHNRKFVIVVDLAGEDPFTAVRLCVTDELGRPVWRGIALGEFADIKTRLAPQVGQPLSALIGKRYAVLADGRASDDIVRRYWDELTRIVRDRGLVPSSNVAQRALHAADVRRVVWAIAERTPFFTFVATVNPIRAIGQYWEEFVASPGLGFDGVGTGLYVLADLLLKLATDKAYIEGDLLTRTPLWQMVSAGAVAGKLLSDPSPQRWVNPFGGVDEASHSTFFYVPIRRKAVATLYLAELIHREVQRLRRNTSWECWTFSRFAAFVDGAEYDLSIPMVHRGLQTDLRKIGAGTHTDDLAERQRVWCLGIAREFHANNPDPYSGWKVSTLAEGVRHLAVPSGTVNQDEYLRSQYGEPLGCGLSPIFIEVSARQLWVPGADPGALSGGVADLGERGAAVESIGNRSVQYVLYYLFGLYYNRSCCMTTPLVDVWLKDALLGEQLALDEQTETLRSAIERMLNTGCDARQLMHEGTLWGDDKGLLARLLEVHRSYGNDLGPRTSAPATRSKNDPKILAETVLDGFLSPINGVVALVKSFYEKSSEDIVSGVLLKKVGLKPEPAKLLDAAQNYADRVKSLLDALGDSSEPAKLAFSVFATTTAADKLEFGILSEFRGNSEWSDAIIAHAVRASDLAETMTEDARRAQISTLAETVSLRIGASELWAPAYLDAFCGVAGSAVQLYKFNDEWSKADGAVQQVKLLAEVGNNLASSLASVATAVRLTLNVAGNGSLLRNASGTFTVTGRAANYYRFGDFAGSVAAKATKFADGANAVVAWATAIDFAVDSDSGLHRAVRAGAGDVQTAQVVKGGALFVSAGAATAGLLLTAPWAGPVGLGCAAIVIAVDWYSSSVETDFFKYVEQVNRAVDRSVWDKMRRRSWKSKYYTGIERLSTSVKSVVHY